MTADSSGNEASAIVLIHGLWMTALSWENWAQRYTAHGRQVIAPSWPGMEGEVEQLRSDPSPIARQDVAKILDHYETIIRGLNQPPIIMGHSFGGAFLQILLDRGLGAAGVGIDAASVRGVPDLPLSTLRSCWSLLRNPLARHKAITITPEQFNYAFTNNLSPAQSEPIYRRYAVPGSRNALLTGANANLNPSTPMKVNFKKDDRAPLLFIAGGNDHVVPASVNKHNAAKYKDSKAITAYREFPGRTHYTLGQDGWEEVADYALSWATNPTAAQPSS
jgi:pimeloyl-ACP methyl ester carboxylesterase